jgi:hypothetical protein
MGLSLGGLFSSAINSVTSAFTGDYEGSIEALQTGASSLGFSDSQIQAATNAGMSYASAGLADAYGIDDFSGMPNDNPVIWDSGPTNGGYQMSPQGGAVWQNTSLVGAAMRLPPLVMNAVVKLSQKFGGAGSSPVAYATKIWNNLSSWAAKNPGVSLLGTLTAVGLTVEEAAHFLGWGATKKKRRRRSGISGRQLATTRRTMRKIVKMYHSLPHHSSPRRVFGGSRTSIVKA